MMNMFQLIVRYLILEAVYPSTLSTGPCFVFSTFKHQLSTITKLGFSTCLLLLQSETESGCRCHQSQAAYVLHSEPLLKLAFCLLQASAVIYHRAWSLGALSRSQLFLSHL